MITPGQDRITADELRAEISVLEAGLEMYRVYRVRDGETLKRFGGAYAAAKWITDQDYDPARVLVEFTEPEIPAVLAGLRELDKRACENVDGWEDYGGTLLREGYLDAAWARGYFRGREGADPDEWPYCCINWEQAAAERVDGAAYITWQATRYYDEQEL